MFEQKSPNTNQPNSSLPRPPENLPFNQPPVVKSQGPNQTRSEPEDILSGIDKIEPEFKGPARPVAFSGTATPAAAVPSAKSIMKEPFFRQNKKIVVVLVLVLFLIAGVVSASWYAYSLFSGQAVKLKVANLNNQTNTQPEMPIVNEPTNEAVNQPVVNQNVNINQPPPPPPDSDSDGLTNDEEAMYGTDPTKIDTDGDDLTDRDEVKVFKTDPNNPDTDGDSYKDGEEVRNGYDPKGSGRLLNIE